MRPKIISNNSNPAIVALTANVTAAEGTPTPIMTVTVPDGTAYAWMNASSVRGKAEAGAHVITDLRKSDGTKISPASRVVFAVQGVQDELPRFIRAIPYGVWYDMTTTQQRSDDYKYGIVSALNLNVPVGIDLQPKDKLLIMLDGPDAVDWGKSTLELIVQERN